MWRSGAGADSLRLGSLAITRFCDIIPFMQQPFVVSKEDKRYCIICIIDE